MKKYGKIRIKIVLMFLLLTAVVAAVMGIVIYNISYSDALKMTEKRLVRCCTHVSGICESDNLDHWIQSGGGEDYEHGVDT